MPKPATRLRDMEIDEVSVVDKGAAPDALIAIAKRATQEVDMPKYTFEDGTPVSEEELVPGDIVFDENGGAFEYVLEDEAAEDFADESELEPVGKAAFPSFTEEIREELSKAFENRDASGQRELFAKAAQEIDSLRRQVAESQSIAKAERDTRLTEAYISKAAEYNLPGDPRDLGPVLFRMAETMSYEDCAVINKALTAAGSMLFQEIGAVGGGDNDDILTQVAKAAYEGGSDVISVLDENPEAYAEYLASQK
jgi:hypothetical protein